MAVVEFTLEHGRDVVYARSSRWRVQFYDRASEQFYAGSSDTSPWEAIAWALAEREVRIANGNHPIMSRGFDETPASWLARMNRTSSGMRGAEPGRHAEQITTVWPAAADERAGTCSDCVAPVRYVGHVGLVTPVSVGYEVTTENGTIQRANKLDAQIVEPKKPAAARRARAKKETLKGK